MTTTQMSASYRGPFVGPHRAVTVGLLTLMSVVAFEALGVSTAMPAVLRDVGVVALYGWPSVAFAAAGAFGTAVGGRWCDRAGPRRPLLVAPALFAAGLLTAGSATAFGQLLIGRALQGLGGGVLIVAVYVLIAARYVEQERPAIFGLMSAAWVVPALFGPPTSGLISQHWS
jgi:MFS family permease